MSPFLRLSESPNPRNSLPLLVRRHRKREPKVETFVSQSTSFAGSLSPESKKRRYFCLQDGASLYDISGHKVDQVPSTQELREARSWIAPIHLTSPNQLLKNVSLQLNSHLQELKLDRDLIRSVQIEKPVLSSAVLTAFREVKLGNAHKIRELVQNYPYLVHSVDGV